MAAARAAYHPLDFPETAMRVVSSEASRGKYWSEKLENAINSKTLLTSSMISKAVHGRRRR